MDNMKNNKMTPGPWRTANHDTLKDVTHVEAGPEGYERETVCICCGKNSAKNSKAIAALPDLIEALSRCIAALEDVPCLTNKQEIAAIGALDALRQAGVL